MKINPTSIFVPLLMVLGCRAQVCFTLSPQSPMGGLSIVNHLVTDDLNQDGNMDILYSSSNLEAWYGTGLGTFSSTPNSINTFNPTDLTTGDVNGDTYPDLLYVYWGNNLGVQLNNGNNTYGATISTTVPAGATGLASIDMNNDGYEDVVVSSPSSASLTIYYSGGNGSFTSTVQYHITQGGRLFEGDFNNDGNTDLVLVTGTSFSRIIFNNGLGGFNSTFPSIVTMPTTRAAVGDLNADGKSDIVFLGNSINQYVVCLAAGTNSFTTFSAVTVTSLPISMSIGDYNGDLKNDLAISYSTQVTAVHLGNNSGNFNFHSNHFSGKSFLSTADFNNDGRWDLASASYNSFPTSSSFIAVNLNDLPLVSVIGPDSLCQGQPLNLYAQGGITYTWSTGHTQPSITFTPNYGGAYSVTGFGYTGCSSTRLFTITVFAQPTIAVSSGSICPGGSFSIIASGAPSYSFSAGPLVSPLATTIYTVTGVSSEGCLSAPVEGTVTVHSEPTLSVNSGSICEGNWFNIVPSGAASYTIAGGSFSVSPVPGISQFTVAGISSQGCAGLPVTSTVTVQPLPVITIAVNDSVLCEGELLSLTASGADYYQWVHGSSSASLTLHPTQSGTFLVTGTNATGCQASASIAVVVDACIGIDDVRQSSWSVYPNPAQDRLYLEVTGNSHDQRCSLYDLQGRLLFSQFLHQGKNLIDLSQISSGLFILVVNDELSRSTIKLLRN